MSLLKFFKKIKKQEKLEFIGRHQLAISSYLLLGVEVPESEVFKAISRDILERAEILSQIETNEENSVSDLKVNHVLSSLDVHTRTLGIMGEGYEKCVLQNDFGLEDRCLKLVEQARSRVLDLVELDQKEDVEKSLSKLEILSQSRRYLTVFELGGLLTKEQQHTRFDTTEIQKSWFIIRLLRQGQDIKSEFTILPPEGSELRIYGEKIKELAKKLLAENKLNNDQLSEINVIIDSLVKSHN